MRVDSHTQIRQAMRVLIHTHIPCRLLVESNAPKPLLNTEFHFLKDYIFTSPSLAAAVVMGRNANGRTEWKTSDHKTIKDIEEENLN